VLKDCLNRCFSIGVRSVASYLSTPISKAEAFSRTFQSAFKVEDKSSLPTLPESIHPPIEEITITESGVFALLCQTDPHKAGGPDNIPARVVAIPSEVSNALIPV